MKGMISTVLLGRSESDTNSNKSTEALENCTYIYSGHKQTLCWSPRSARSGTSQLETLCIL